MDTIGQKGKRPYVKPQVTTIDLAAEEVLYIGCKGATFGWAFGGDPCAAFGCLDNGS